MKLTNRSPYDARVLRRCFTAARRWLGVFTPDYKNVLVVERRNPHLRLVGLEYDEMGPGWVMRLPKLTGNEWHHAARGIEDGDALTCRRVVQGIANGHARHRASWVEGTDIPDKVLKKLPVFVPMKVTPEKPKPDRVAERYTRVVELERAWLRKQKLATTKVKLYRKRRRRYEKMGLGKEAE